VALANKKARILWAMLTKDVRFNADHVSERGQPLAGWRHRGHAIEDEVFERRAIEDAWTGQTGGKFVEV
jgi:hypothetical protein